MAECNEKVRRAVLVPYCKRIGNVGPMKGELLQQLLGKPSLVECESIVSCEWFKQESIAGIALVLAGIGRDGALPSRMRQSHSRITYGLNQLNISTNNT